MTKKKRELIEILLDNVKPEDWPENLPYAVYGKETCKCYASSEKPTAGDRYWWINDGPESKLLFSSKEAPKYWNKTIVHRDEFMKRWNERNHIVDSEGWIQWSGGEMPVENGTLIDIKYRNGKTNLHISAGTPLVDNGSISGKYACDWLSSESPWSITSYRLHAPQKQKTPQQLALEKFGTDWHVNEGVQPFSDTSIKIDLEFKNGTIRNNVSVDSSSFMIPFCTPGFTVTKWRIHSDEKESHVKATTIKAAKQLADGVKTLSDAMPIARQAFDGLKQPDEYLKKVDGEFVGIEKVISDRGIDYGRFEDGAEIMQQLKLIAHTSQGWERMKPIQREGMDMILHKIGRILNGDPSYIDSWIDIEGYSKLVSDWLKGDSK